MKMIKLLLLTAGLVAGVVNVTEAMKRTRVEANSTLAELQTQEEAERFKLLQTQLVAAEEISRAMLLEQEALITSSHKEEALANEAIRIATLLRDQAITLSTDAETFNITVREELIPQEEMAIIQERIQGFSAFYNQQTTRLEKISTAISTLFEAGEMSEQQHNNLQQLFYSIVPPIDGLCGQIMQSVIQQLVTHLFKFDVLELGTAPTENATCTICLDTESYTNWVKLGSCGHTFHKECLQNWLPQNFSCPNCRAEPKQTNLE